MRKTLISLATASLIVSSAMAADKGVDFVTTGKAVVYYQTADNGANTLFDSKGARANAALQLNLDADLKNDFTFGSQINYLGTLGLEKNLVGNTMQDVQGKTGSTGISDDIYLSQFYIAKKIANTTVKLGRQELPKSLSPFAFSEDWNVFTNTFDAALVVNTDLPNTTLVGAYVGGGNQNGMAPNMAAYGNLTVKANGASPAIFGTAYMVTAQNKSLPMATVTATYYDVNKVGAVGAEGAKIVWGDVAIADKSLPMGLKLGIQGGQIAPDAAGVSNTTAFGAMASLNPIDALNFTVAYSSVNDGVVAVKNVGGVKTPLYTQMTLNQDAISLDSSTVMLKAAYNAGDYGTIVAQGTSSSVGAAGYTAALANKNFTDLELVYKIKAASVDYLAILANTKIENSPSTNTVRVVASYKF